MITLIKLWLALSAIAVLIVWPCLVIAGRYDRRFAALLLLALLCGGCATNGVRGIHPEAAALYPPALSDAISNYRNQWHAEPQLPTPWVDVVDQPRNGMAAWTTGEHIWISRPYLRRNILAHEVGHTLDNKNGKANGEATR